MLGKRLRHDQWWTLQLPPGALALALGEHSRWNSGDERHASLFRTSIGPQHQADKGTPKRLLPSFGSLTTPPCTEGVSWNLLNVRETVCQRQVEAIQNAFSATQNGIGFNNCVTTPLTHRTVAETNPSLSASTVDAAAAETSDITNTTLSVSVVIIAVLACLWLVRVGLQVFYVMEFASQGHWEYKSNQMNLTLVHCSSCAMRSRTTRRLTKLQCARV